MTRSRCIFPLIPCLCTLFRLACYISREAFLIIVPVKKYRLLLIRFDTGIFRRCIGTLTVLSYRCGPLVRSSCDYLNRPLNLSNFLVFVGFIYSVLCFILQSYDDGKGDKSFSHALVAGVDRYPRKVTKKMSNKKVKQRSKIKPFLKVLNFNHIMATR